jgi:hypothetical protein
VAKQRDSETSESVFGSVFSLLKQTFQEWVEDKAPQLGAALAYYTVFSLAPKMDKVQPRTYWPVLLVLPLTAPIWPRKAALVRHLNG